MFELVLMVALATAGPTASPTPWPPPAYVALDYGKPGQPSLMARQVARIRQVLAEVKPCQRPLVRYVIGFGDIELFFYDPNHPDAARHIFDTRNGYYAAGTELVAGPPGALTESQYDAQAHIQWDVAHQPCPPSSK